MELPEPYIIVLLTIAVFYGLVFIVIVGVDKFKLDAMRKKGIGKID
jgi:hypothetical protein